MSNFFVKLAGFKSQTDLKGEAVMKSREEERKSRIFGPGGNTFCPVCGETMMVGPGRRMICTNRNCREERMNGEVSDPFEKGRRGY